MCLKKISFLSPVCFLLVAFSYKKTMSAQISFISVYRLKRLQNYAIKGRRENILTFVKEKNFLYENFCTPFCHFFLASAFAFWHEKRIFAGYEV